MLNKIIFDYIVVGTDPAGTVIAKNSILLAKGRHSTK
ncbi:hypothetical protein QOZ95_003491 [Paenibacillus brasilensis]|uniref:Uncharacterized protein n=1 Tax=Paenibacillus brasilensis TaxID=128574 RepID=A0ABU0L379_9BACL|nr:hypothetical protein [Paenibacillus brasilensis]